MRPQVAWEHHFSRGRGTRSEEPGSHHGFERQQFALCSEQLCGRQPAQNCEGRASELARLLLGHFPYSKRRCRCKLAVRLPDVEARAIREYEQRVAAGLLDLVDELWGGCGNGIVAPHA